MRPTKDSLFRQLKERDGLLCGICHQPLEIEWAQYEEWHTWKMRRDASIPKPFKRKKANITIDHIMPKSVGKKLGVPHIEYNSVPNLQLAHDYCNNKKGNTWENPKSSPENGPSAPSAISPTDSSTVESPTGSEPLDTKSASSAESPALSRKEKIAEAEANYNLAAKMWNEFPGEKLMYPRDKFVVKYCYCTKAAQRPVVRGKNASRWPYCKQCGFALPVDEHGVATSKNPKNQDKENDD